MLLSNEELRVIKPTFEQTMQKYSQYFTVSRNELLALDTA